MYLRNTGKLCFATLQDGEGRRLQAMLSRAEVGEEALAAFKADVDLGDHLFVRGRDRKSTRLNSSHVAISYAVFCLKKKKHHTDRLDRHVLHITQPPPLRRDLPHNQ